MHSLRKSDQNEAVLVQHCLGHLCSSNGKFQSMFLAIITVMVQKQEFSTLLLLS